jgi:hypothetical protein
VGNDKLISEILDHVIANLHSEEHITMSIDAQGMPVVITITWWDAQMKEKIKDIDFYRAGLFWNRQLQVQTCIYAPGQNLNPYPMRGMTQGIKEKSSINHRGMRNRHKVYNKFWKLAKLVKRISKERSVAKEQKQFMDVFKKVCPSFGDNLILGGPDGK